MLETKQPGASEWLAQQLRDRSKHDPKAGAWADIVSGMRASLGYDVSFPDSTGKTPAKPLSRSEVARAIIKDGIGGITSPDLVTSLWRKMWQPDVWGGKRLNIPEVPPCDRTEEELREQLKMGRYMLYLPESLSTPQSLHVLERLLFPERFKISTDNYKGKIANTVEHQFGWMDVDILQLFNNQNTNLPEHGAKDILGRQGREGATLNTFYLANQFAKHAFGKYFGEDILVGTFTNRVLSSEIDGKVIYASWQRHGEPGFYLQTDHSRIEFSQSWRKNRQDPHISTTSVGIKRV